MHLYVNTYDTFIIILPRVYTSIPGEIVQVSLEEGSDAVFSKQRHENFFSPPPPYLRPNTFINFSESKLLKCT